MKCFPYSDSNTPRVTGARPWALSKGLANKSQVLFLNEYIIKQKLTCNPIRQTSIVQPGKVAVDTWDLALESY